MKSERRFRFGAVAGFGRSGPEWAATARHIEELGFATLLCPDGTGMLAPFQALSAAAAATRTLRLGSYVLAAPLRTPAAVAWETASLDVLSAGRFELGLGAGRPAAASDAARPALGGPGAVRDGVSVSGSFGSPRTSLMPTMTPASSPEAG